MWLKDGKRVIATMIQVEDNHVIKYSPPEEVARSYVTENREIPRVHRRQDGTGYGCMIVGALSGDPEKFTKDYCGLFTSSGLVQWQ
jgi:large subunit ribosomal protein L3